MAVAWPSTLQQLLSEANFSIAEGDTVIRSDMDIGPQKVRRRFTQGIDLLTASIYLTNAQYTIFKNFYRTSLNGGVLTFEFNHPIEGDLREYRFKAPPQFSSIGGDNYVVQLSWEELP